MVLIVYEVVIEIVLKGDIMIIKSSDPLPDS